MIEEVRVQTLTHAHINTHVFTKLRRRTTGCVCIFKTSDKTPELVAKKKTSFWSSSKKKKKTVVEDNLEFHVDFQSHEPEFDYLKSLEIEEKINKIKFCKRSQSALMLLTTNDKTIKLWKVYEKQIKTVSSMKLDTYVVCSF